jgi:asparagine synthase (glutamine-hydrolysing)
VCGLVGEFRSNRADSDPGGRGRIEPISEMMVRRGPDDGGLWDDPEGRLTLGFQRLAVIDKSQAARQPMVSFNGNSVLVFNGEVYNFRELRSELQLAGLIFRSRSDTEVVLEALERWGTDAIPRLNGMFAFAWYRRDTGGLVLARDPAGVKPLYWLRDPRGVVFASQYDQVMAHPWARPKAMSRDALALYLRLGYIPPPYGALEDTHLLESGTWVEVDAGGGIRQERYFSFPKTGEPTLFGEEAADAVADVVAAAVRRQLVSDVPLGVFLSGGIDSPLVAAEASMACGPLKAFTIAVEDDRLDESSDAASYARELGLEHTVLRVTANDALAALDDVIDSCSEPFADYSIFPTLLVSRLAREHVTVALSGDGGDELFWGYAGRFASVIEKAEDFATPHWARSVRWWGTRFFSVGDGYSNLRFRTIGEWYRAKHQRVPERWLETIFPDLPDWPASYGSFGFSGSGQTDTAQWLRWNEFNSHLGMVLLKVDRASMFNSLEVRVPLLDREVMEMAAKVDWSSCLELGSQIGKIPLRRALARRVRHQTREKRGFAVPMGEWLRGPLLPLVREELLGRKRLAGLKVDRGAMARFVNCHLTGAVDLSWAIWVLLSLALWENRHFSKSLEAV